jgi:uncharacterized membrane protein
MISNSIRNKLIVSIIVFSVDYIWLKFYSNVYGDRIEKVQKEKLKVKYIPVVICYTVMLAGLNYIMNIKSKPKDMNDAIKRGAIFGFVSYTIFNSTNMAIFKEWDEKISLVDTTWGTILNGLAGGLYFYFGI